MSTNDDSASRRGRRADQAEPDWRAASRSGNQYPGQTPRDSQPQNTAYSGFTRQSYSPPPAAACPRFAAARPRLRRSPRLLSGPCSAASARLLSGSRSAGAPAILLSGSSAARLRRPGAGLRTAASPYDSNPQHMPYGGAGGELFGRDPAAPQSFDQGPYGANSGYRPDSFEPAQQRAPLMPPREEERYVPRAAPEPSAPRYYPEEQPQRSAPPLAAPPALDRGYAPPQPHSSFIAPPRTISLRWCTRATSAAVTTRSSPRVTFPSTTTR